MIEMRTARHAVDRKMIRAQVSLGITYLADHVEGSIDVLARHLDRLNVANASDCPLGILFGSYYYGLTALDIDWLHACELGFSADVEVAEWGTDEYPALTHEWRLQVTEWITEKARDMVTA